MSAKWSSLVLVALIIPLVVRADDAAFEIANDTDGAIYFEVTPYSSASGFDTWGGICPSKSRVAGLLVVAGDSDVNVSAQWLGGSFVGQTALFEGMATAGPAMRVLFTVVSPTVAGQTVVPVHDWRDFLAGFAFGLLTFGTWWVFRISRRAVQEASAE